MSDFIIFDTEFEWNRSNNPYPPRPDTVFEVIQIGALRIRRADQVIMDKLDVLIRPRLNPCLSPYFCTLTGITAEAIAREGLAFEQAASRFMTFCGTAPAFAYGDDAGRKRGRNGARPVLSVLHRQAFCFLQYGIRGGVHLTRGLDSDLFRDKELVQAR